MTDSIVDAAKKITAKEAGLAAVWFLGSVAPGFLIVFHFLPKIAEEYEFLKLLLLSISLSLPVIAFNLAISIAFQTGKVKTDKRQHISGHWFDASAAASMSTYISLYMAYYFNLKFPTFVAIILMLDVLLACSFGILDRIE